MSRPTYDGKGQPTAAKGWFSGFAAWWQSLTPQYVTCASRTTAAKAYIDKNSIITGRSLGAPSSAPEAPRDSSEIASTASGAGPHVPSAS